MRVACVSSLLLFAVACGGAQKPAESADTSSLESSNSSAKDMPAAPEATASASSSSAASDKPASDEAAPAAAQSGKAPDFHQAPSVNGLLDGRSFAPKMAHVIGRLQKDKRILVSLDESTDCPSGSAKPDDTAMTIVVPWEDGYKIDLASLKRASKKSPGEIGFFHVTAAGKKVYSTTFKPSGRLTVVKAPMDKDGTGKLNVDLQAGDYMLAGDLDVQVCVAPK